MTGAGRQHRRRAAGVWVACGLVLGLGVATSGSWACVPQPFLLVQPRSSGPPGTQVTVYAQNMGGVGRVELRWNALDGPLLGTADGPSFSLPVTIPDQPSGLYALVALERQPDGGLGSLARTEFAITTTDAPAPAPSAKSDGDGGVGSVWTVVSIGVGVTGAVALFIAGATWSASRRRRDGTRAEFARPGGDGAVDPVELPDASR